MTRPLFDSSCWLRALSLAERLQPPYEVHRLTEMAASTKRAVWRLERWRAQAPFSAEDWFERRLAGVGLSLQELAPLLNEPGAFLTMRELSPPAWMEALESVFSRPETSSAVMLPQELDLKKKVDGFLYAIEPLLAWAHQKMKSSVQELLRQYPGAPVEAASVLRMMYLALPQRLFSMLQRTLLLELQVARLQGVLEGDAPDARFSSFVKRLREPQVRQDFLREYAVLGRRLMEEVQFWHSVGLEFLERLCTDWDTIRASFVGDREPGKLVSIRESGDRHAGGRAVRVLEFSSGFQVVYKPRSMSVDVHYQQLLEWLNARRGGCLPFCLLKVLDRGSYGWSEFVPYQPCSSLQEVERFYERQGSNLALHYVLQSTDMHFENLIAAGEYPLLVDLESLFHSQAAREELVRSQTVAARTLRSSVLRVSLLPQYVWADATSGYGGIDLSGMDARSGQLGAERAMYWEDESRDTMRVSRRRMPFEGGKNRPTIGGTEVPALDYTGVIVEGFTKMYRLLQAHREELLSDQGPLARFAQDRTRILVRHTRFYDLLLQESYHPDVLRDALERDQIFDRLWYGIERAPYLRRVIHSEHEDLWRGDVPSFSTCPGSADIWDSQGRRIANFLAEPGLETTRRCLREMGEADLRRQVWFIEASMSTLAAQHKVQSSSYRVVASQEEVSAEPLLVAAEVIAARIEALALRSADDAAWIGQTPILSVEPLWVDLYDGVPGLALFLAYLGALTGQEKYTLLARQAWTNVQRQIASRETPCTLVGPFTGLSGIVYVASHLGSLWKESVLLDQAVALLDQLPTLIDKDTEYDLMGGSAGCILALDVLRGVVPRASGKALELSVRCGERLLARAQKLPVGLGWTNTSAAVRPLSGFAHGAAGFALALLQLSASTGEERFREAGLAALEYERSVFSPREGNWCDLRDPRMLGHRPDEVFFSMAWCHGAPGIGLARLRTLAYLDDPAIRADISAALETTSARAFGSSHSLCHGDLGNVDVLLKASEVLEDGARWRLRARQLGSGIMRSIQEHGWQFGNPNKVEMPGLMTGLAGIGYGLLRLAVPERVPSVLGLESPIL